MSRATARNLKAAAAATIIMPDLAEGERYAGILFDENGAPSHHLVLLPGTSTKDLNWEDAKAWAKKQGGELPTRREQSLLMANAKQHINGRWHWSSEQYTDDERYAWYQGFTDGYQSYDSKDFKLRARAVRRLPIR